MTRVDDHMLEVFKALGDENRLAIVRSLGERGEVCACELLDGLGIKQSTLSHHMKVLCACGLVRCRKEGRWCYYSIDPDSAQAISSLFHSVAGSGQHARPSEMNCECQQ
ncbi:MAG: metalloregulator ArsR/SmtB family transcription factor [Atopobiaceae bacterium]